jgi:hypothetical protein
VGTEVHCELSFVRAHVVTHFDALCRGETDETMERVAKRIGPAHVHSRAGEKTLHDPEGARHGR